MILRIGALLLLAAAAWALARLAPSLDAVVRPPPPPAAEAERPAYYLSRLAVEEFGEDGRLRLRLTAASAAENPASGAIEARDVAVDYLALADQAWRLTAATATVPADRREVALRGSVVMSGTRDGTADRAVVRTDRLLLLPEEQRARTDAPVTLAFGRHELEARGLDADLKARTLRLESSVNGQFTR